MSQSTSVKLGSKSKEDEFDLKTIDLSAKPYNGKKRRTSSLVLSSQQSPINDEASFNPELDATPVVSSYPLLAEGHDQQSPFGTFGLNNPKRNRWRFISACLWSILGGWNDGAPGCLLPYIEDAYGLQYTQASLIWMGSAVGFITIAIGSHHVNKFLNNRQILICSCVLMILMTAIVSSGTLFPVIVVGFFLGGIGSAMGLSQLNIIFSNLDNCPKYLGIFHGSYGLGATLSPILATVSVSNGLKWNYFYFIALFLMSLNIVNVAFAFKGIDQDLNDFGLNNQHTNDSDPSKLSTGTQENVVPQKNDRVKLALKNYKTWLISLFLLFYQGLEVSLGGFIVSYLIDYRSGVESKIGYVASGYWGGLTVGRMFLVPIVVRWFGLKKGGIITSVLAMVFIALSWAVPSIIAEAIFISVAGMFIGPIYPLLIQVSTKILPRKIQIISLTIMSSFGSSGGAIFPFITGLLSDRFGSFVVLPMALILYVLALVCWLFLQDREQMKNIAN